MRRYPTAGMSLSALLLAAQFAVVPAFAEVAVTIDQQTSIAVTIYNQDLALIRDTRNITLKSGENDLAFIDVSAVIRPETALLDSNEHALDIIEQNFDYDLLSPGALMEKAVGQTVTLNGWVHSYRGHGTGLRQAVQRVGVEAVLDAYQRLHKVRRAGRESDPQARE